MYRTAYANPYTGEIGIHNCDRHGQWTSRRPNSAFTNYAA